MMHERYYGRAAQASSPERSGGPGCRASLKPLRLLAFALLVLLSGGAGCGGPTFSQGIFDDGVVRYRVGDPGPGWQRVEVAEDASALVFHHDELAATVSINATCKEYEDVPEEALLNHLLFGMRERVFRVDETITLDGRGAVHAVVDVQLDGVPVTLEIYLVRKDGCVYDMTLIASREAFERARGALARLTARFHVLRTTIDD
ncbi:MAG TPA: hypothetical protein VK509_05425 [Polyangiales bacterium]|nr:hypothetical protein [Polyangiales bacterium]